MFYIILLIVEILPVLSYSAPTRIVVVGGTHGNEYTGVWCIKSLEKTEDKIRDQYPSLEVSTLLANPKAFLANRRFLDDDLNRQFSHELLHGTSEDDNMPATVESLRAQEINSLLGPKLSPVTDVIVDLHTTTSNMGTCLIVAENDVFMTQAAAYVMKKCTELGDDDVRILLHTHPNRETRPNLSSTAKHGFTIEVGPVPQGVLRHDAVERTQRALHALLEYLQIHNSETALNLLKKLQQIYPTSRIPCFRSAPARRKGELSGKIVWPSDPENPNFPALLVHKHLQDRDFEMVETGDPLFVDLEGKVINYDGSHGSPVYLMFINEGGYYYASSGTGVAVAIKDEYSLETGKLIKNEESEANEQVLQPSLSSFQGGEL